MKRLKALSLGAACAALSFVSLAATPTVSSLEDYNKLLPFWGVSWSEGSQSTNGYYPSFYTGFVMRQEAPERIHVHTSRGNQTRVSVILDETTVNDYVFDLAKRYSFYKRVTGNSGAAALNLAPKGGSFLPQLSFFNGVIESQSYGILPFVDQANKGQVSSEAIYSKSLQTLKALNPGRVFDIRLDLKNEFNKWKAAMQQVTGGNAAKVTGDASAVVSAIDTLVLGRINYIVKPTPDVMAKLTTALNLALSNASDEQFIPAALDLFNATTGTKYQILTLNQNGQWEKALQCSASSCVLTYPEFTAIYPTGSVQDFTSDDQGNRIGSFATVGLWQFVSRSGGRTVDNIRNEPFYGFIPKMDFQDIGNGFHNPAVRFWDPSKALKAALGIAANHDTLWAAKRGGISHGCLRLPTGHVWELRHIFPVENSKMTQLMFFANAPQDFDLYDVTGEGRPKVMGVEYLISYGLQGVSDAARREGSGFEINNAKKLEFYTNLYGSKNVFKVSADNQYTFINPRISLQSYMDYKHDGVKTRLKMNGEYPLYEQSYEREKVQFYALPGDMLDQRNKDIARIMGRVRGCAPSSDKTKCGEAAFDQEANGMFR